MRKILFYISLFTYIYPVFLSFFPIPTDRILQLTGFVFCILNGKFFMKVLKIKNIFVYYFSSLIILALIFIVQGWNSDFIDLTFFKIHFNVFTNLFSATFIIFLLFKIDKNNIVVNLLDSIIIVTIIQAFISFLFYFNNYAFETYVSMLSSGSSQKFLDRLHLIEVRLIGVSSSFFTGGVKYSIPFLILIILPYLKDSKIYKNKFVYIFSFIVIIIAGIMTARTFFIVIPLSILLFLIIEKKNIKILFLNIIPKTFILFLILSILFSKLVDVSAIEKTYNFVFEMFINYQESGDIQSSSTEAMKDMYVFPDNIKTWLIGDGKMVNNDNSYYMHTDIGYSRLIFYFGIFITIFYLLYQGFLFFLLSRKSKDVYFKPFILMLYLWYLILNLKGLIDLENYIILFFIAYGFDNLQNKVLICDNNLNDLL